MFKLLKEMHYFLPAEDLTGPIKAIKAEYAKAVQALVDPLNAWVDPVDYAYAGATGTDKAVLAARDERYKAYARALVLKDLNESSWVIGPNAYLTLAVTDSYDCLDTPLRPEQFIAKSAHRHPLGKLMVSIVAEEAAIEVMTNDVIRAAILRRQAERDARGD